MNKEATNHNPDLSSYKKLLLISVPIMLGNLAQTLYNLADAYFLGKLGKEAVSAPSIAFNIVFFLIVFAFGFSIAGTTLISQAKGRDDQEKVDFYLGQSVTALITASVVVAVVGLALSSPLLKLLLVPADTFDYTLQYLRIILMGMPFMFISFALQSSLQGIGNSVTPLIIQGCTVTLNVVLDPLLIYGIGPFPELGVRGAAIATVFSRVIASGVAIHILVRGKRGLHLKLRNMKPQRKAFLLLMKIGIPASIGQAIAALGFTMLQGIVNSYGTAVIAAFGVGNRIIGLFNMPAFGLQRGTAILVGQNIGAKDKEGAKRVMKHALIIMTVFITIGMTYTFFWGNTFVRVFIDDPEVIGHGVLLFRIVSVSIIFFSLFSILTGAFQGAGDTKPVMYMNAARLWILRIPVAYLLARVAGLGPVGIWWSMFFSNVVIAAFGYWLYKQEHWLGKMDAESI